MDLDNFENQGNKGRQYTMTIKEIAQMAGVSSALPQELRALLGELISDVGERVYLRSEAGPGRQRHEISVISAPVFDHRGTLTLAITLLGTSGGFEAAWETAADRLAMLALAVRAANADAANRNAAGVLLPIDLTKFGNAAFQQCPNYATTDDFACMVEEGFRKIKAENYFDLTLRFNVSDNLTVAASVQNLLDNKPKIVGNTIGSTTYNSGNVYPSTYDALGRRYAVSAKLKF